MEGIMKRNMFSRIIILCVMVMVSSCTGTGRDTLFDGRSVFTGDDGRISGADVIEGRVYDYRTRKGISGASVEIKNANLGVGYYKTRTDSRGRLKLKILSVISSTG